MNSFNTHDGTQKVHHLCCLLKAKGKDRSSISRSRPPTACGKDCALLDGHFIRASSDDLVQLSILPSVCEPQPYMPAFCCTALHCTDALPCSSDIFRSFDIYCTALVLMSLLCVALLHFQAWAPGAALDMGGNLLQRYEGGTYHCTAEICPQVCDEENHIVSSVFFFCTNSVLQPF
jgi:hypothetical protein